MNGVKLWNNWKESESNQKERRDIIINQFQWSFKELAGKTRRKWKLFVLCFVGVIFRGIWTSFCNNNIIVVQECSLKGFWAVFRLPMDNRIVDNIINQTIRTTISKDTASFRTTTRIHDRLVIVFKIFSSYKFLSIFGEKVILRM